MCMWGSDEIFDHPPTTCHVGPCVFAFRFCFFFIVGGMKRMIILISVFGKVRNPYSPRIYCCHNWVCVCVYGTIRSKLIFDYNIDISSIARLAPFRGRNLTSSFPFAYVGCCFCCQCMSDWIWLGYTRLSHVHTYTHLSRVVSMSHEVEGVSFFWREETIKKKCSYAQHPAT